MNVVKFQWTEVDLYTEAFHVRHSTAQLMLTQSKVQLYNYIIFTNLNVSPCNVFDQLELYVISCCKHFKNSLQKLGFIFHIQRDQLIQVYARKTDRQHWT